MKKKPEVNCMTILREKKSKKRRILIIILVVMLMAVLFYLACLRWKLVSKQPDINMQINKQDIADTTAIYMQGNLGTLFSNRYNGKGSLDGMKFCGKKTVEKLKSIYNNLDFFEGFQKGDLSVYDYYAKRYTRFLKSEAAYYDTQGKEHYNLSISSYSIETLKTGIADGSIICLMFDMDGDGMPELCLAGAWGAYVFKYIPESDQYVTWWEAGSANYQMMGSRKVRTLYLDGGYQFYQLNKSGEEEWGVFLGEFTTENEETIYVVSLPTYKNGFLKDDIVEEMREDGYYDEWYYGEDRGRCLFRVTEDEYNDVSKPFFDAVQQAYNESENFTFTPNLD